MPIYEYDCTDCGKDFDVLLRRMDQKVSCPECGGENLRRKLSTFGAQVKGSGAEMHVPPAGGCGGCAASPTCPMSRGD